LGDVSRGRNLFSCANRQAHAIGIEQYRFAAAVWRMDPMGQIIGWAKDAFDQLTMAGLSDFLA
jgi:hypothetical protein